MLWSHNLKNNKTEKIDCFGGRDADYSDFFLTLQL